MKYKVFSFDTNEAYTFIPKMVKYQKDNPLSDLYEFDNFGSWFDYIFAENIEDAEKAIKEKYPGIEFVKGQITKLS